MFLKSTSSYLLGIAMTFWAGVAQAQAPSPERYALLIAATAYPEHVLAGGQSALQGPANDVTLLYNTLVDLGFPADNVRVLADSLDTVAYERLVTADGMPTKAEIIAGLEWLVATAAPGDEVLVYLSGHGSYLAEADKPGGRIEPDGTDELFLPIDIGVWNADDQVIDNQILDDELGELIRVLVDRGVFVWFVVDACHSGTAVRAAADGYVTRYADPAIAFGVPAEALERPVDGATTAVASMARPEAPLDIRSGASNFVAFYASLPAQRAVEGRAPPGAEAGEGRVHGLMTWSLVQALRGGFTESYETMARRIVAGYWEWGGAVPTPMFEGALDARPFVGAGGERVFGIDVVGGMPVLAGGQVDDVGVGTIIAVFQQNMPQDQGAIAFARVTSAGLESASLEWLPDSVDTPNRLMEAVERGGFRRQGVGAWLAAYAPVLGARVVERVPGFVLRVAAAVASTKTDAPDASLVDAALQELEARPAAERVSAMERVPADAQPDVVLTVADGRVWFTPGTAVLITEGPEQAYSLSIEEATPDALDAAFRVIARARNLNRIAREFADTPVTDDLSVEVSILAGDPVDGDGHCAPHSATEPRAVPSSAVDVATLGYNPLDFIPIDNCDQVFIVLSNLGTSTLDLTPLYLDPWSQTYFLAGYRDAEFGGLRLAPGETRIVSYTENTASTADEVTPVGYGQIMFIAVVGDPARPFAADFRHLTGALPDSERRDAGTPADFRALLDAGALGNGTVRSGQQTATVRSGVATVPFRSLPP